MSSLKIDSLIKLDRSLFGASHLETFKISNLFKVSNMENMFYANRALKEIDLSNFDTSNTVNCRYMFQIGTKNGS